MNHQFKLKYLFLSLSFLFLTPWCSSAAEPEVCVVSLWHGPQNESMILDAQDLLRNMGYSDPESRFTFFGYPTPLEGTLSVYTTLTSCLEGGFEEVIIIGHRFIGPSSDSNIVFIEDSESGTSGFINDRFFNNVQWSEELRQITLVTCGAENTLETYQNLRELAQSNGVNIRLAPVSPSADFVGGLVGLPSGLRLISETSNLIAEASQDPSSPSIFCYFYLEMESISENGRGGTSCLRNYFYIEDKPYHTQSESAGADWIYLAWQTIPAHSEYVNIVHANPRNQTLVESVRILPEGSRFYHSRDGHNSFSHAQSGSLGIFSERRVFTN